MSTHQYNPTYMLGSRPVRAAILVAALAGSFAAYRWWISPERHIHRILNDVAAAVSHEEPENDLRALTAVAALQTHLSPDVSIDAGTSTGPVKGRQDVMAMAARLRASTPMMRLQFFDADITLSGDSAATTRARILPEGESSR